MATMNIIQAMNRLRSDIQTWVANNLKTKVNTELKTGSTEEYKVLSDNNFTDADKNKLDGIAERAEVNVQSDWNVTDSNSDAFIKNQPSLCFFFYLCINWKIMNLKCRSFMTR